VEAGLLERVPEGAVEMLEEQVLGQA